MDDEDCADFIDRIIEEVDEFVSDIPADMAEEVYGGIEYGMNARIQAMKVDRERNNG